MLETTTSLLLQQRNNSSMMLKRKHQPITKKLRSSISRRKRAKITPIPLFLNDPKPQISDLQADSSSSSCFPDEITSKPRSKRQIDAIPVENSRRITRSYYKRRELEKSLENKGDLGVEVSVSESSCVESFSGANCAQRHLGGSSNEANEVRERNVKQSSLNSTSGELSLSETSCIQQISLQEAETRREIVDSRVFEAKIENASVSVSIRAPQELSLSEISRNYGDESTKEVDSDYYDLSCSEHLSYEDADSSEETTLSDIESDIFPKTYNDDDSMEYNLSDYSYSDLTESPTEFSQGNDSTPPLYFNLFQQYSKQFLKLSSNGVGEDDGTVQEEYLDEFTLLKFEDEEHEESYKKFRTRERRIVLRNYAEEYVSTTEYGDLVLQQRLLMVNWIVELSNAKKLHPETMFLGVSLLDRFLTQGFFKSKRKLQVLGIACLTLATRIEENQPLNSVRQLAFHVGSNSYGRSEVVAMEWLVQETLNFQCFLPTTYNFLWFYLKAAKADAELEKKANYLAMLSLLDNERLSYWPSTVAAGLVILASLAANRDSSCQWVMETHVRTKKDDLPECIQSLDWLVKYVC
ncbi:hypothetical protein GIB67_006194 [Kingdonia uniflora]|uniref:Cyclin-like domain-containing protein n=1 Tax=Kingdonia uniflora TaxID=39325 RepID=A0A7J7LQ84_9MAGN|nr:hypothetical protein GIB67_006194 [Kingdonia uniflora]